MRSDILILGDGVAGLSCAIAARQTGLRVTVLSGTSRLKNTFHVLLHPGAECLFDTLGLRPQVDALALSRPEGYWLQGCGNHSFVPYGKDTSGPWRGYVLNLSDLETSLRTRACDLGVKFADQPCDFEPLFANGAVSGLRCLGKDHPANLTIDASGGRQLLHRKLRLKPLFGSPPLIATYTADATGKMLQHPSFDQRSDGWCFSFGIGAGRIAATDLNITTHRINPSDKICRDVSWQYLPECAGPGYAVIGDAALRLDPASGAGVLRAMMMGIKAPDLAKHPDNWRRYRQWVRDWAFTDGLKLAEIYAASPFQAGWAHHHCWTAHRPSHSDVEVRLTEPGKGFQRGNAMI